VKLFTLGVGEVDKDAVLQAGKAEIDRLKAASQEIVFEMLDIVGGLCGGGIETPRLGLVKKIVDKMDELATRFGNFDDHGLNGSGPQARLAATLQKKGPPREVRLGTGPWGKASWISSGDIPRATAGGFFDRQARDGNR
jgi:hypothetical protein